MTASSALVAGAQGMAAGMAVTVPRLYFVRVPSELVRGVYNGKMPARSLFCHPDVWPSLKRVLPRIVLSDLTRTAESSLSRMAEKPGLVQAPGYSDHNYGGAFDLDIKDSITHGRFDNRRDMDEWVSLAGFPMFWWEPGADAPKPNKPSAEIWHHSYWSARDGLAAEGRSTAAMAERRMLRWYPWLDLKTWIDPVRSSQAMLAKLGHYHGAQDGIPGPLTRAALGMFQRALQVKTWCRKKGVTDYREGYLDAATARVLAFCSAERVVTEAPL